MLESRNYIHIKYNFFGWLIHLISADDACFLLFKKCYFNGNIKNNQNLY